MAAQRKDDAAPFYLWLGGEKECAQCIFLIIYTQAGKLFSCNIYTHFIQQRAVTVLNPLFGSPKDNWPVVFKQLML